VLRRSLGLCRKAGKSRISESLFWSLSIRAAFGTGNPQRLRRRRPFLRGFFRKGFFESIEGPVHVVSANSLVSSLEVSAS